MTPSRPIPVLARGTSRSALLLALGMLTAAGPALAQDPATPPPAAPAPRTGGWGAVDIVPRSAGSVVAVTILFPRGSSGDPEGAPGATWLLARVAREMTLAGLDPAARAATEIAVDVGRSRTAFRLATLPRYWEEAYGVLEWAVLRAGPSQDAITRVLSQVEGVFEFESDAPHREFEEELYRMLSGPGTAWSRSPRGSAATTRAIGSGALASVREAQLRQEEAVLTVVGAVDRESAGRTVADGPALPDGGLVSPTFAPLGSGSNEAWETGERLRVTREVTSTWLGVAFPVDPETPPTALEMLVHRLDAAFNSEPPDPGAFSVDVRVEHLGARRLLVVEAAVLPEAERQWTERIVSEIETIAAAEMEPPYFRAYRRRFRAARLLDDAPPEVEGLRRATDLLERGEVRALATEVSRLVPDDLQEAADDLGDPRILAFGPDLGEGSSR